MGSVTFSYAATVCSSFSVAEKQGEKVKTTEGLLEKSVSLDSWIS